MAISEEICNYFSDLIKLFALTQSLEEMFSKLKEEMVSKFEEKPEQQINRIDKLELALQENMSDQLEIKCDDNEQYRQRTDRNRGIVVPENESNNIMAVVRSCREKINVSFDQDNLYRVERVGNK